MSAFTYKQAGVDIDAGNELVGRIKPLAKATQRAGVLGGIGGFGALFDLKATGYQDPILVSATDGVGTKLHIAELAGKHDTIGIDLVAMCVNDLVVQGAEPLFFLDYFATGTLSVAMAEQVISGIAEGCKQAGCALAGGETAEMPGLYAGNSYDLAGFAVGVVERSQLLPQQVAAGNVVLGLASTGVHSNGFSLVRRLIAARDLDYASEAPFAPGQSLQETLLTPTRIYVKSTLAAIRSGGVQALAHITGGGLLENIPRVLPAGLGVSLRKNAWPHPPVFSWLQQLGTIDETEMLRTFNCGIGMVLIVAEAEAERLAALLAGHGETVFHLGEVTLRKSEDAVAFRE